MVLCPRLIHRISFLLLLSAHIVKLPVVYFLMCIQIQCCSAAALTSVVFNPNTEHITHNKRLTKLKLKSNQSSPVKREVCCPRRISKQSTNFLISHSHVVPPVNTVYLHVNECWCFFLINLLSSQLWFDLRSRSWDKNNSRAHLNSSSWRLFILGAVACYQPRLYIISRVYT